MSVVLAKEDNEARRPMSDDDAAAAGGGAYAEDYASDTSVDAQYFASYGADFAVTRAMLTDAPRMAFYAAALCAANVKGKVVVDVGAGTGILSLMAARAGAAQVVAIEASDMADAIPEVAARTAWVTSWLWRR